MKYAVIKSGGKQYRVVEGQVIRVEKLDLQDNDVVFPEVLLSVDDEKVEIGTPTISGFSVYATLVDQVKGEKIEVFKYKSKSRYRKHTGHRQKYTKVKIISIGKKPENSLETKKTKPIKKTATKKVTK